MDDTADLDAASEPFGLAADDIAPALVLDVRRAAVWAQVTTLLPGAAWHDPALLADWAGALPRDRRVVVYCVHGHHVSRAVALQLRAAGVDAYFLRGGIAAWQAQGRAVVDKLTPPASP